MVGMHPDDADFTVVRPRPKIVPSQTGDLEADTLVPPLARREPEIPVGLPALVEPPALVEQRRGFPVVVEQPVSPRVGLPIDPDGLTVLWYRIRINRHEPIPLNIPALIGRQPVCPRIAIGGVPRLVRVPSPRCEVSSTHVELRQHGASVVVTDLRSTNGTIVSIPGSSSQKLRQGESLVVSAGTVVDIGDGNTVEILPIQRLV